MNNRQNIKPARTTKDRFIPNIVIQTIIILLLIFTVLKYAVDKEEKLVFEIKYLANNKKWDDILKIKDTNVSNDRIINFYTNMALYHTGRLTRDMFNYPQNWGKYALFLSDFNDYNTLMDNSDLFLALGHYTTAKHWAYEAQTIYENSPRVIKQIALINLILENKGASDMALNILEKSSIHKSWTKQYRHFNINSRIIKEDSIFPTTTKMVPLIDFYIDNKNPDIDLQLLLEDNNRNKMAFEYLMAYYLLTNNLSKFAANLKYLRILNYKQIPIIYQEALLVYLTRKNTKGIDMQGYSIDAKVTKRFEEYAKIILSYNQNLTLAKSQLSRYYKNTYWYYLHYVSPVTTKKETKIIEKR